MKFTGQKLDALLANWPATLRAAVIFGPDEALVRARARQIGTQIVPDQADPFRVAELTPQEIIAEPARLYDEVAAFSLSGGARLVRIAGATAAMTDALVATLEGVPGGALILVLAGELTARDKLRLLAETREDVAAIACYPLDQRALAQLLTETAEEQGYHLAREVAEAIAEASGQERDIALRELEKLCLYAGNAPQRIDIDIFNKAGATRGAGDYGALIEAVCGGDPHLAAQRIDELLADGEMGIALLRAVGRRLWQLAQARAALDKGAALAQVSERALGRLAWRDGRSFQAQVNRWSAVRLEQGLARLMTVEREGKLTGVDTNLLAARALLGLASR